MVNSLLSADLYSPLETGAVVVVCLTLVELVKFLVTKVVNGNKSALSNDERVALYRVASESHDLHVWHSPDYRGRQDWKGMGELLIEMKEMNENLRELVTLMKQKNDGPRC